MTAPLLTRWQRRNWHDDFERPDPVVVSIWRVKLRFFDLTEGEINAFVRGKLYPRGNTKKIFGPYHQVERSLYFFYESQGNNGTSRQLARAVRDRIFDELGWSKEWGNLYISVIGSKKQP